MPAGERKKTIREISPIDVYTLLPRTNCRECGEANCMAFATRVVNGELAIGDCPPILTGDHRDAYTALRRLMAPPVRTVRFGSGDRAVTIGGKYVLFRHEFTYHHPPPVAIDIADDLPADERTARVRAVQEFSYNYIGRDLRLDAVAVRSTQDDPAAFAAAATAVAAQTPLPLILCAYDPACMDAALAHVKDHRPLLYAATRKNWKEMAECAIRYHCPLVVSAPGDIPLLKSLVRTLGEYGISDIVLDPGTSVEQNFGETLRNFTLIRRAVFRDDDGLLGYPIMGTPIAAWLSAELSPAVVQWREACAASMLISRYADLLVMHSLEGWVLLPPLIWRFNTYTDPRKPVSVEAGVRTFGSPGRTSPVLITTNYALTYFTVEADIRSAHLDCYLIVVDTGGISVESAVAGRYLTAESMAAALREYRMDERVDHRCLIVPGLAARLSGDTAEASGWEVIVGPKDSSGLPAFIRDHWPPGGAPAP